MTSPGREGGPRALSALFPPARRVLESLPSLPQAQRAHPRGKCKLLFPSSSAAQSSGRWKAGRARRYFHLSWNCVKGPWAVKEPEPFPACLQHARCLATCCPQDQLEPSAAPPGRAAVLPFHRWSRRGSPQVTQLGGSQIQIMVHPSLSRARFLPTLPPC